MFNKKSNKSVPVFQVKKKHSWRGRLVRLLEVLLIVLVLLGTLVWYLVSSHFSFNNFFKSAVQLLSIKVEKTKVIKQQTDQDKLKSAIEESKVFEIESIKGVQGGFEVKSKSGLIVDFSKEKNFDESIRTLQTLLAKAKIDNKTVKQVDFRFDKIIVKY